MDIPLENGASVIADDKAPFLLQHTQPNWGQVRACPYGACLKKSGATVKSTSTSTKKSKKKKTPTTKVSAESAEEWHDRREQNLAPLNFPLEGYGHVHGQGVIDEVDKSPLGSAPLQVHTAPSLLVKKERVNSSSVVGIKKKSAKNSKAAAGAAEMPPPPDAHDYGSTKTADDAPVGSLREKWRLLPYFLQLRSLLRQHIDSYDHFINKEMQAVVQSPSAREIRSDHDPNFYWRYEACWVGEPSVDEDAFAPAATTPFQCRLRDCTYSAPIYVNVRYTRGRQIVVKRNVMIGRMPVMLRSQKCILRDKSEDELAELKECPYDPGGYFIIKGVEKVILIQEQLSKNRVILEDDGKGSVTASITTSTHERKSKAYIIVKHRRLYLKNNTLGDDIPIAVVLKAMGIESDVELVQLVGSEPKIVNALALSLEEPCRLGIYTQHQALKYIGGKIRGRSSSAGFGASWRKPLPPADEAREVLANVVLAHVPVQNFDFRGKAIYIGHIIRRVLMVLLGEQKVDDKDYYGNKRLEVAGNLLSLLFEDLFKIFNSEMKKNADKVLSKPSRAQPFDMVKYVRPDIITHGMVNAIATGNWVIKRFRMDRAGVTQVLSRLSYMSSLGMMTRINSQFEKTRKVSGPRSLQASQWGMLCPADTPEGEACGLVKNLALTAHITTDDTVDGLQPVERVCRDLGVEDVKRMSGHEIHMHQAYLVLLNGLVLGVHTAPGKLVTGLRQMRRRGLVGEFVSVYLHEGQRAVHIATDGGRVCRPLLIVDYETGRPKLTQFQMESLASGILTIKDLLRQGVVEYVDCNEENNTFIAVTERDLALAIQRGLNNCKMRYTHLEVDPFTILGVIGGVIPVCCGSFIANRRTLYQRRANKSRFLLLCSFLTTIKLLVIRILLPWPNKLWALLQLTNMNVWMG